MKYAIKRNGKYLSNLFRDDVDLIFQAKEIKPGAIYAYNVKQIAQNIARQLGGTVVTIKED